MTLSCPEVLVLPGPSFFILLRNPINLRQLTLLLLHLYDESTGYQTSLTSCTYCQQLLPSSSLLYIFLSPLYLHISLPPIFLP